MSDDDVARAMLNHIEATENRRLDEIDALHRGGVATWSELKESVRIQRNKILRRVRGSR